jgi:2,4-dienoyl-CoA reductase-like NADH-dependent reductase (Old Yellow Enzyme family)
MERTTHDDGMRARPNALLEPFSLGHGVILRNRIVIAPMTTWAGNDDGTTVSDEEEAYYRLRVKDVGLVITGDPATREGLLRRRKLPR